MADAIDLDAAEAESTGEGPTVILRGEKFDFPAAIAFEDIATMAEMELPAIKRAISAMLGDQAEAFWGHRPTIPQINALLGQLTTAYGFGSPGEPLASSSSSGSTSGRSRPTSAASTD